MNNLFFLLSFFIAFSAQAEQRIGQDRVVIGDPLSPSSDKELIFEGGGELKYLNSQNEFSISSMLSLLDGYEVSDSAEVAKPCPEKTDAQRDALTPSRGNCVFNIDTLTVEYYDGTEWAPASGSGVEGPASATVGDIAVFDAADGHSIGDSGANISSGSLTGLSSATVGDLTLSNNQISSEGTNQDIIVSPSGSGEFQIQYLSGEQVLVSGATGEIQESTVTTSDLEGFSGDIDDKLDKFPSELSNNRVVRTDTDGNTVQGSLVEIDDMGSMDGLTALNVDNLSLNGNTITSTDTDGSLILDANGTGLVDVQAPFQLKGVAQNQVPFGDDTTDAPLVGSSDFLYESGSNLLRAGGVDLQNSGIEAATADTDLDITSNGTASVNVDDIKIKDSAITGTDVAADLTINASTGNQVEIGDVRIDGNTLSTKQTDQDFNFYPNGDGRMVVDDLTLNTNDINFINSDAELITKGGGDYNFYRKDSNGNDVQLGSSDPELKVFLDDPSFERGVSEWSCTDATATAETGSDFVLAGKQSAKIEITADGGFCDLTVDFSGLTAEGSSLYVGAQAATKDSTMEFNLRKDGSNYSDQSAAMALTPSGATIFDFYSFGGYPIATGVTGIRVGGNNGDIAYLDEGRNELAELQRTASKDCSGTLDCENVFAAHFLATGEVISESLPFIESVVRNATGNYTITFKSGVFYEKPSVTASVLGASITTISASPHSPTKNSVGVLTFNASGSLSSQDFSIVVTRQGTDYKTTQQQGVVLTGGNSAGALLSASNSSETTSKTIATTLSKIDLADVTLEEHIKWDTTTSEGEVLIDGTYLMMVYAPFYNPFTIAYSYATLQVDDGSGFSETGEHPCVAYTRKTEGRSVTPTCPYSLTLKKGDKFRVAAVSSSSNTVFLNSESVNGKNVSPRLTVVPVLTRAEIAAEISRKVILGQEQWFGDYVDGEKVYQYCNEVATDITTSTTIETIDSGLRPYGVVNRIGTLWNIYGVESGGSASFVEYDKSDGRIVTGVNGSYKVGAGTTYCLQYRKP